MLLRRSLAVADSSRATRRRHTSHHVAAKLLNEL